MHVITRKRLREFVVTHPEAEGPMTWWHAVVSKGRFQTFAELRNTFNSVEKVGKYTVFNVGKGKYRVITVVHYNRQKLYIRNVLTHAEYDRGKWKK